MKDTIRAVGRVLKRDYREILFDLLNVLFGYIGAHAGLVILDRTESNLSIEGAWIVFACTVCVCCLLFVLKFHFPKVYGLNSEDALEKLKNHKGSFVAQEVGIFAIIVFIVTVIWK
jgi:hypothetical protein